MFMSLGIAELSMLSLMCIPSQKTDDKNMVWNWSIKTLSVFFPVDYYRTENIFIVSNQTTLWLIQARLSLRIKRKKFVFLYIIFIKKNTINIRFEAS